MVCWKRPRGSWRLAEWGRIPPRQLVHRRTYEVFRRQHLRFMDAGEFTARNFLVCARTRPETRTPLSMADIRCAARRRTENKAFPKRAKALTPRPLCLPGWLQMPRPRPQYYRQGGLAPVRRPPVRGARRRRRRHRRPPRKSGAVLEPLAVSRRLGGSLAARSLVLRRGRRRRHRLPRTRDDAQLRRRRRQVPRPQARDVRRRGVHTAEAGVRRARRDRGKRQGAPRQRRVRTERGAVGEDRGAQRRSTRLRPGQGPRQLVLLQVSTR